MRENNSIKNSMASLISSIVVMLASFITQAIFIRMLGSEYLGLNGLFTNILTMLSFFELGIGDAIVYNMYKPIAENNTKKIKQLMNFYKKAYTTISILVFGAGLLVIPFLKNIVGEITIDVNIYVIYIMFLINTSSSYLLVYRRNLIQANQQKYIISIIHIGYVIVLNCLQMLALFMTKNYYLYLAIKFICQMAENAIGSIISTRMYPYIKENCDEKLDSKSVKNIIKKVKGLIFHKVGGTIIYGTDNIIVSCYLGVSTVGLYTNYSTIITAVTTLFQQAILSTSASVGNLLITENSYEKKYNTFKKMRFLNFLISCFSSICILVIITPFITIWIGEQYILDLLVTCTLVFNYFQKMQRSVYMTFKDSAGIWVEDRFVPLVESVLNIVFSIILLKIFGLAGVFMGTIVSGLALWCYSYPKFVYKKLFNRSYLDYAKETVGYILLFILLAGFTYYISTLVVVDNIWIKLICNTLISLTVPNIILVIIFRKTDNFKYFMELFKKLLSKFQKKLVKQEK